MIVRSTQVPTHAPRVTNGTNASPITPVAQAMSNRYRLEKTIGNPITRPFPTVNMAGPSGIGHEANPVGGGDARISAAGNFLRTVKVHTIVRNLATCCRIFRSTIGRCAGSKPTCIIRATTHYKHARPIAIVFGIVSDLLRGLTSRRRDRRPTSLTYSA